MSYHMQVISEHLAGGYLEFMEVKDDQIYVTPGSEEVVSQIQHFAAEAGFPAHVKSELGGFNRLPVPLVSTV
jgi:hypothetical protein